MIRIHRQPLKPETLRRLQKRTARVISAGDAEAQRAEVERLWAGGYLKAKAFDDVRATLCTSMAPGLGRCMYCQDSAGTDIEHFRPKADYPHLAFEWSNYLWACSFCNSNQKRDSFPLDDEDQPLLIDPTVDEPLDHLTFSPATGIFVGDTPKGETSIELLGLNRDLLVEGRSDAWVACQSFFERWATAATSEEALSTQRVLCRYPYASVVQYMVLLLKRRPESPFTIRIVSEKCRRLAQERPELLDCV
ncbi:MAG: hypothetical protein ACE366_03750 [Bradymonadia bacterium]